MYIYVIDAPHHGGFRTELPAENKIECDLNIKSNRYWILDTAVLSNIVIDN